MDATKHAQPRVESAGDRATTGEAVNALMGKHLRL
jgi:hypothetical protein